MIRFFTGYSSPVYLDSFSKDLFIKISVLVAIFTNAGLWILLSFYTEDISLLSALHYNIYFGIDLLKPWYNIFAMPASGLGILAVNLFLTLILYRRDRLLSYFLIISAAVVNAITLLAGVFIIFVLYN
jgi:hypothetical protein